MRATFVHEIGGIDDMRVVVRSARHQLMQTIVKQGYNILLSEGYVISVHHLSMMYTNDIRQMVYYCPS